MIDRIVVENLANLSINEKVYDTDIDYTFEKGKLNKVDPRIPIILEYFGNAMRLASWTNPFTLPIRTIGELKFRDPKEFLSISIEFSERFKYTVNFDGGYITEDKIGGIFSESLETLAGQVLLSFDYLDLPWENGQKPSLPKQPLINFGQNAFEHRDILEELRSSFLVANWWSTSLIEGTSLRTVRENLQGMYSLSEKYIKEVWKKWIPGLDIGIDRVDGDTILVKAGERYLPMSLGDQGSGAKMLFRSLPVLLLEDRSVIISNRCSYLNELHPILKKHLLNNILFEDPKTERTIIIQECFE